MHDKKTYGRAYSRLKNCGWTQQQFDEAWLAQGGRCAICETFMDPQGRSATSACADHDHMTGERRGLLCKLCNTKLAPFENPGFYRKALAYLARTGRPRTPAQPSGGRPLEGWKIRRKKGRSVWDVRFTHNGQEITRSTHETDEHLAAVAAERIFSQMSAGLL